MSRTLTTQFSGQCTNCRAFVAAGVAVRYDGGIEGCPQCDSTLGDAHSGGGVPTGQVTMLLQVRRVKFQKQDDAFAVVQAELDREDENDTSGWPFQKGQLFAVAGRLGEPQMGALLEVVGSWQQDSRWGWQFKATSATQVVGSTLQALRSFLTQLPNVGPQRASAIIRLGDSDRDRIVALIETQPEKLTSIAGITEDRAAQIQEAFTSQGALRESALFLAGLNLGERLSAQILDTWGAQAKTTLIENPYELLDLDGVGFERADQVALGALGVAYDDPRRAAAVVFHLLRGEEDEGHTWTALAEFGL